MERSMPYVCPTLLAHRVTSVWFLTPKSLRQSRWGIKTSEDLGPETDLPVTIDRSGHPSGTRNLVAGPSTVGRKQRDAVEATRSDREAARRCFRCGGRPAFSRWVDNPQQRNHSNCLFAIRRSATLVSITFSQKPARTPRRGASNP